MKSKMILGADEVAIGSWAGPIIIVAAQAGEDMDKMVARDSKKYSRNLNRLWGDIRSSSKYSLGYGMCILPPDFITDKRHKYALSYGFKQAVANIRKKIGPRYPRVIIDGDDDHGVPFSVAIIKADDKFPVVSLASCIAKAAQIKYMQGLDKKYPMYGFKQHNGYGTQLHYASIKEYGAIAGVHRMRLLRKVFFKRGAKLTDYKEK